MNNEPEYDFDFSKYPVTEGYLNGVRKGVRTMRLNNFMSELCRQFAQKQFTNPIQPILSFCKTGAGISLYNVGYRTVEVNFRKLAVSKGKRTVVIGTTRLVSDAVRFHGNAMTLSTRRSLCAAAPWGTDVLPSNEFRAGCRELFVEFDVDGRTVCERAHVVFEHSMEHWLRRVNERALHPF